MHASFLPLSSKNINLHPQRLDIWQFSLLKEPSEAQQSVLRNDEMDRANRFYFTHHRRRFINARAYLRQCLARYLHQDPHDFQFEYNPQGKPLLPQLQFNLSHSQDLALLAITQTYPVGIDIEFFSARPYLGIAQHLFSETEYQILASLPPELKALGFFHVWSQKEALIKAVGLGLSYPTKTLDVPLLTPTHHYAIQTQDKLQWHLSSFCPTLACAAAVCYSPQIQDIYYGYL